MSTHTKIIITVGFGFRKDGSEIPISEAKIKRGVAEEFLLDKCGTYTVTYGKGGRRNGSDGPDWRESVFIFSVTVPVNNVLNAQILAAQIRDIFQQQCVALETQPVNFELV